jgi:hypothetical protein
MLYITISREYPAMPLPGLSHQASFIRELYVKHLKKRRPANVRSIEQMVCDSNRKIAERIARKQAARLMRQGPATGLTLRYQPDHDLFSLVFDQAIVLVVIAEGKLARR